MNSSMNPIKVLAHRFVSLQPLVRMKLTKKLLELYSSEQASREIEQPAASCCQTPRKSFLEQFWDEVEEAHGDHLNAANPFTAERRSNALRVKDAFKTNEQDGYLPWRVRPTDLFASF
jgi:hypothetical protein